MEFSKCRARLTRNIRQAPLSSPYDISIRVLCAAAANIPAEDRTIRSQNRLSAGFGEHRRVAAPRRREAKLRTADAKRVSARWLDPSAMLSFEPPGVAYVSFSVLTLGDVPRAAPIPPAT